MVESEYSKLNKYISNGVMHVHSVFSDGSGDINEITLAAKSVGLEWIIITDHNTFDVKEGIYNGVCVIKGEEVSPCNGNHYLALGINEVIEPADDIQLVIDKVKKQGGFGIAAHPDETVFRKNVNKPIRWIDKSKVPDGVEIWNWFSAWADNLNDKNLFNVLYAFLFRHNLVKFAPVDSLNWWDELNNIKSDIVSATGGVDAHALKIRKYLVPLTIFPYKMMFGTITNLVYLNEPLAEEFEDKKSQILLALRNANNFIINRSVCPDVPFFSISNSQCNVTCGEQINLDEKTFLTVRTDKVVDIRVILNGERISQVRTKDLQMPINKKGKYRVEIFLKNKAWAYSNPIVVC